MFGLNRKIDENFEYLLSRLNKFRDDYWELWQAHQRLLNHLGLTEEVVPQHTILKKIKKT